MSWLILMLVVAVGGLGVVGIVLWLIISQSGSSEPSCGRCGYAVRGLTTFKCPECGSDLRNVGIRTAGPGETVVFFAQRLLDGVRVIVSTVIVLVAMWGAWNLVGEMFSSRLPPQRWSVTIQTGLGAPAAPTAASVRGPISLQPLDTTEWREVLELGLLAGLGGLLSGVVLTLLMRGLLPQPLLMVAVVLPLSGAVLGFHGTADRHPFLTSQAWWILLGYTLGLALLWGVVSVVVVRLMMRHPRQQRRFKDDRWVPGSS